MTNIATDSRVGFDAERALAATSFTGSNVNIGTALQYNPVVIVFDNQTDVSVPLLVNSSSVVWKTFSAGEAFVLDLRANNGRATNYTIDVKTQFSTTASAGTSGSFRISIIYAK